MEYGNDFFKKILDSLYDSVYFCDKERKITYWNKAAEKLTGYTANEITGTHCWDQKLVHTNIKGENLCGGATCPAVRAMKEKTLVEEEIYLRHKDGHRIPVLTRISPIYDEGGNVTGAVEIFSDNSAKMSAFAQIEKLEKLALQNWRKLKGTHGPANLACFLWTLTGLNRSMTYMGMIQAMVF